jgi:membrane protease YdiL (CAAX protease family)
MNTRQIVTFIALSYLLISFVFYGICGGEIPDPQSLLVFPIMYTPALAAFLTTKIFKEKWFSFDEIFGRLNRWTIIALLSPLLLMAICAIVSLLFIKGLRFNPNMTGALEINDDICLWYKPGMIDHIAAHSSQYLIDTIVLGLGSAWSYGMLAALGEEIGWRGYLLKKVEYLGFWKSVFIIGPIWGLWHFPLILKGYNYPTNPVMGIPMMMLAGTALTPILIYLRKKANSIWAAALFHGSSNALTALATMPIHGHTTTFFVGFLSFSGIFAACILFVIIHSLSPKDS